MAKIVLFLIVVALMPGPVAADVIQLRIPHRTDGTFDYYHDLLTQSLEVRNQAVRLIRMPGLPQKRSTVMLEADQLDIIWLVASEERNRKYTAIPVGITDGLLGQRVLFVPKEDVSLYQSVNTLEDFRRLGKRGGFGENWFDIRVWQKNRLPLVVASGDWRRIYNILENPARRQKTGIDYFSRGSLEIVEEAGLYPNLAIEPALLLIYERDFYFYLAPARKELAPILTDALKHARDSGLMVQIIRQHFGKKLSVLNLEKRVHLNLETPK